MKKLINYLILIAILLFIPISAKAITIDSIDMDVFLDEKGDAHITEKWVNPTPSSGSTEFYKAYDNLGKMKIKNFTVSYNNQTFTYNDDWDIDDSFSEKSYKNGLYYEDSKTELCWGISTYTSGTYTLTYTIENFIVKLNDADMVYFNFIPSGNNINSFHLKMYSDKEFNKLPVWGFGKKNGTAYVYDGYIEMNSESALNNNEYITLLVDFDKDTFSSTYKINKDFDYYLKLAKKGSSTPLAANPIVKFIKSIFRFILTNFYLIIIFVFGAIAAVKSKNKIGSYKYDFGKRGRKLPKDVNKVRDIPFDDIYKVYYYSVVYNLNKNKTDLLGASILKWLKDDKLSIEKGQSKILKKEEVKIVLKKDQTFDNLFETSLYTMMYEASGDGILESNELKRWCRDNYNEILKWFDRVIDDTALELQKNQLLTRTPNNSKFVITDEFYEEACKVKGVKDFLLEFSRIDDKEAIEVKLWEYYLIYAQIFGIADKVAKQFKKLYPNEIAEYNERYGYGIDDLIMINYISRAGISSAISSKQKAESYSSGGGGFMSGGGGGGSFGGGGSMGSR